MKRTLEVTKTAWTEAQAAASWYEQHRPGYAGRFRRELDSTFVRITDHPESYQAIEGNIRRAFLRRFAFAVVYVVYERTIVVVSIRGARVEAEIP